MGLIREPEGVDFIIEPSQTFKEDVAIISNYIQKHKKQVRTTDIEAKLRRTRQVKQQYAVQAI